MTSPAWFREGASIIAAVEALVRIARSKRPSIAACVAVNVVLSALFSASAFSPAHADYYLSMLSILTGREIGRAYRIDGAMPSHVDNTNDQKACLSELREVSKTDADRIAELVRTDREAASIEFAKAIRPCMTGKGWRIVIAAKDNPDIGRSAIAALDAVLDKLASSLPQGVDQHSDLVRVRRDHAEVTYTMRVRPQSQDIADELRKVLAVKPHAAEAMNMDLMKKTYCAPLSDVFLGAGVAVRWEMFDDKGLLWRIRLASVDCQ